MSDAEKDAPGQVYIVSGMDVVSLDGLYFECPEEANEHAAEWGGKVIRYVRADQ